MKKEMVVLVAMLSGTLVQADQLTGVDRFLCAAAQVQICIENDTCYASSAWEADRPDFVVIGLDKKKLSTTKASKQNRSTPYTSMSRSDGQIVLQGLEGRRTFSFVIDEATGRMTVAVARDRIAVNVFGVCTGTEL